MNFRLTYDGPLKAQSQSETRRIDKHLIRCAFHLQLANLLNEKYPYLLEEEFKEQGAVAVHKRGNFRCFSLVRESLNLVCDLDILFLRRDNPGRLVTDGGDLDNRIKVLFDALRVPQDDNEVRGLEPDWGNDMLFCLTEDDSLITGFRVTSDRLLDPVRNESDRNNVRLVIGVEIKVTKITSKNLAYFSHF